MPISKTHLSVACRSGLPCGDFEILWFPVMVDGFIHIISETVLTNCIHCRVHLEVGKMFFQLKCVLFSLPLFPGESSQCC